LRKFSSEEGSASLEILSDEGEDEGGGPCAFDSGPPFSSVASVGIVVCVGRLVMADYAVGPYGQPLEADQSCEK